MYDSHEMHFCFSLFYLIMISAPSHTSDSFYLYIIMIISGVIILFYKQINSWFTVLSGDEELSGTK